MRVAVTAVFLALAGILARPEARAGESADYTRQALAIGARDTADQELTKRIEANPADDEARFGLAMIRFLKAIEDFGHHHYRHGLDPTTSVPFLRMPVPVNTTPERLTYEAQRSAFRRLLEDLARVEQTLAAMTGNSDIKIAIDLNKVPLTFTESMEAATAPTIVDVIGSLVPMAPPPDGTPQPPFEVAFDRADALWLQGYCHLLSAGLEFILAHDWRDSFDRGAGLFYPSLRPLTSAAPTQVDGFWGDSGSIADAVAMAHEIRWRPDHPERLLNVRTHLKQVVALSRRSWQLILAETDDDREWIPAPAQNNAAMPMMKIGQDQLNVWQAALTDFDAVLDGRKLIPHWRFDKGVNLRLMLEEPRVFDAVLWVTGHAAIPYLQDGQVLTSMQWRAWEQVFGGNFLVFAVYLN